MAYQNHLTSADNIETVGLIPAAGKASRISPIPCSKELFPIGFWKTQDSCRRPKVVSHYLLEKFRSAGVTKVFIILKKGKWDIPAYFGDGSMLEMDIAYLLMNLPFGVPFTLDQAYPFIRKAKVMMGFPDILFGPDDAFVRADKTLNQKRADIVIGLLPVKNQTQVIKCDMVQWDENTRRIINIQVKPKSTALKLSWIFAIWTPVFTKFMHNFLRTKKLQYTSEFNSSEIHLGHVVQYAISEGLRVFGHLFEKNTFIDIGTTDELIDAYKTYQKY